MEDGRGYIENVRTGEKVKARIEKRMFVYDVQMEEGQMVTMTLNSGVGCALVQCRAQRPVNRLVDLEATKERNDYGCGKWNPNQQLWPAARDVSWDWCWQGYGFCEADVSSIGADVLHIVRPQGLEVGVEDGRQELVAVLSADQKE